MLKRRRFWHRLIIYSLIGGLVAIFGIDRWVKSSTRMQLYTDVNAVPHKKVGLLLGTSKTGRNGWPNLYYKYRIEAAAALFKAGKIDYILISGDNGSEGYDEPTAMRADMLTAGIPDNRIILDYAGFRTLDSILRCKKVFGEDDIVIISQRFHDERALFLANKKGLKAIAYCAQDVPKTWSFKVMLREKLARVKMLLDLSTNKGPKFYGPKIKIG